MSGKPHVDVFYSFRSPYSYLAIGRLAAWAGEDGIDLVVRPVLPLAIRQPEFFENANPMMSGYVRADAPRVAAFYDIPFKWPDPDPVVMTFNPLHIFEDQPYIHRLTRLGVEAQRLGQSLNFAFEVSTLIWSGGVPDWSAGDHLAEAVGRAGLDLAEMDRAIEDDAERYDRLIEQNQDDHRASGHWGVPCMVFEGEPFFGQDRIDLLKWRVRAGSN